MSTTCTKLGLAVCSLLCCTGALHAQSRTGTTAATFLTLGTGARAHGLGQAYTTMASGGDALFWNPAGAARPYLGTYRSNAFFTHYEWVAGIDYNAGGVVLPITSSGVVGLSIATVDYGRMDVRTVDLPEGTGETFTSNDLSLGLTYAQPLTSSFYFGGTVKYIRQGIRDMSARTVAFDFGFLLETRYFKGLKISASIQNFGGKMQMSGVNSQVFVDIDEDNSGSNPNLPARIEMGHWDLPLSFRFGAAMPVLQTANIEVLALGDVNQTNDQNLNGDFGGQFRFRTKTFNFDVRAGYKDLFLKSDRVDSHASYGAGLDVRVGDMRFGFDYAYIPFDLLDDSQLIDVRVAF